MTGKSLIGGHHVVRRFEMGPGTRDMYLPDGWKPFAYQDGYVVCRKWVRAEEKMETKLLLFGGEHYYPSGGWHDLLGRFDTIQGAVDAAPTGEYEWWHIVHDGRVVVDNENVKQWGYRGS